MTIVYKFTIEFQICVQVIDIEVLSKQIISNYNTLHSRTTNILIAHVAKVDCQWGY